MSKKDPAFLLYTSDFLTGTVFLTMQERGQYITILCLLHQHGGCLTLEKIEMVVGKVSSAILEKLVLTKHGYHHKRLTDEIQKRVKYSQSRKVNGLKGGRPTKAYGYGCANLGENENRDIIEDVDVFNILWLKYPRRLGKSDALRHFKATVKTDKDLEDINKALDNYIKHIKSEKTEEKFIKHGSTWFNKWRDWVDYTGGVQCQQPRIG